MHSIQRLLQSVVFVASLTAPWLSMAHPHMWIDARVKMHLDDQGRLSAVTQSWTFDDLFSSYAIQGLKLDAKRQPLQKDLDSIAANWIEALGDPMSHYFTKIEQNEQLLKTGQARNVQAVWDPKISRLTLVFELPLATPVAVNSLPVSVRVADPTFFVAYEFDPQDVARNATVVPTCTARYVAPRELDPETANRLASIPADQPEPPPELLAITRTLEHRIDLTCAS